jgi:hypothetical protein
MSNLYHKFAVASVGIALGFALGANKEAKAATFTLSASRFLVADTNLDGLGDWDYGGAGVSLPVGIRRGESFSGTEYRAFYQFNIAQLSLASNTVISSAIFKDSISSVENLYHPHHDPMLEVSGYVGNGSADRASYFSQEGVSLGHVRLFESSPGTTFNLNVTTFVNQIVSNRESFAEFGFRTNHISEDDYYGDNGYFNDNRSYITLGGYPYPPASLTIITVDAEPVPEPTTIFGSVIGLCLGGWLKRKKSSQQNKITP